MGSEASQSISRKTTTSGETTLFQFAVTSMQGWRKTMEDTCVSEPDFDTRVSLFAVFDGHGGSEIAKFCQKYFPKQLKINSNYLKGEYEKALEDTFLKIDEMLATVEGLELLEEFTDNPEIKVLTAGCTANVVLITSNMIYVANSGDSRTVIYTNENKAEPLSVDHTPLLSSERTRIKKAGGFIVNGRVNRYLNVTRAIGDFQYKLDKNFKPKEQIITSLPEIKTHSIKDKDDFLLMASDGVWGSGSNEYICKLIHNKFKNNSSENLQIILEQFLDVLLAIDYSSKTGLDNMTVILIKFKNNDQIKKKKY